MTSLARLPALTMSARACRTSPRSGGREFRKRIAARALLTDAPMGCFTSWAIDAVSWPIIVSRATRPSSACTSRNASSARLRSMN